MAVDADKPVQMKHITVKYTEWGEYHYFASFGVSFGYRAVPTTDTNIVLSKIWFDGLLVFDKDREEITPGLRFYFMKGTSDQMPAPGLDLAYRDQLVIWFMDCDIGTSGQLPTVSAEFIDDAEHTLGEALTSIAERAGYGATDIEVSESLNDISILGYILDGQATLESVATDLGFLYDFTFTQSIGKAFFTQTYVSGSFVVTFDVGDELAVLSEGNADNQADLIEVGSDQSLPVLISADFFDVDNNYQQGNEQATRKGDGTSVNLSVPIIMGGNEMRSRLFDALARTVDGRNAHSLRLPPKYMYAEPGDAISWQSYGTAYYGVIVRATLNGDWSTSVSVAERGANRFTTTVVTQPPATSTPIIQAVPVRTVVMDVPDWNPDQVEPNTLNLRVAMGADVPNTFKGARFDMAPAENINNWVPVWNENVDVGIGVVTAFNSTTITFNKKNFQTSRFNDTDDAGIAAGENLMIIGASGRWELLQWKTHSVSGNNITLSGLTRGLFGTDDWITKHAVGDTVVFADDTFTIKYALADFLNSVKYAYRGVGAYQKLSDVTLGLWVPQGNSRKPYSPNNVAVRRELNGDLTITWDEDTAREEAGFAAEPDHVYSIDIFDSLWHLARRTPKFTGTTYTYTIADQTTDGLNLDTSHNILVYRINASHVGRGFPGGGEIREVLVGILSGRIGPVYGFRQTMGFAATIGPLAGPLAASHLLGGTVLLGEAAIGPVVGLEGQLPEYITVAGEAVGAAATASGALYLRTELTFDGEELTFDGETLEF